VLEKNVSYLHRKVITMKMVTEITGLSERQVRYYEKKKLVFPARTASRIRKYSFSDIELLMSIAEKIKSGLKTKDINVKHMQNEEQVEQLETGPV